MAEFLINNRESHDIKEYGDIIAVRADGFKWSESELPKVVKVPNLKYEEAIEYEKSLYKGEGTEKAEMVKHRKYSIASVLSGNKVLDSFKSINIATLASKITVKSVIGDVK